jgi:hypothetical protein
MIRARNDRMGTQAPRMSQCQDATRNSEAATVPPVRTGMVVTGGSPAGSAAAAVLAGNP